MLAPTYSVAPTLRELPSLRLCYLSNLFLVSTRWTQTHFFIHTHGQGQAAFSQSCTLHLSPAFLFGPTSRPLWCLRGSMGDRPSHSRSRTSEALGHPPPRVSSSVVSSGLPARWGMVTSLLPHSPTPKSGVQARLLGAPTCTLL